MGLFKHSPRRAGRPRSAGFTLIELLVVITILGILAAIVVFSVAGLGDRGLAASVATDQQTIRTAEESYFAQPPPLGGVYADEATLKSAGFLATDPGYNTIALAGDKLSYSIGAFGTTAGGVSLAAACTSTAGPLFLVASPIQSPAAVGQCDFDRLNGITQNQFTFTSPSSLATTANSSATAVLFASSDELDLNKTITGAFAGNPGTCSGTCAGIGATKTQIANGRLVIYSCSSTLSGPCSTTARSFPAGQAPTTVTGIISALFTAGGTTAPACGTRKLAIAQTGSTATFPLASAGLTANVFGYAAWEALTEKGTSTGTDGYLSPAQFNTLVSGNCIIGTGGGTSPQANVQTGAADVALVPKNNVAALSVTPVGDYTNDANPWTVVPTSAHSPIHLWAVVLNHSTTSDQNLARAYINYLLSGTGRGLLAVYGFDGAS